MWPRACRWPGKLKELYPQRPDTDVLVLGNHGLVLGGKDCQATDDLLAEIERRLAIPARDAHPADYALLAELAADSSWDLPDDDAIHALATDPVSRKVLEGGFLYPCQAMFSDARTPELFHAAPDVVPDPAEYAARPFLIVKGRGVVLNPSDDRRRKSRCSAVWHKWSSASALPRRFAT